MSSNLPTEQPATDPTVKGRSFSVLDYIDISLYSFGLRGFTFALSAIVVPVLLLDIVPEDRKNAYLGLAMFAAFMLAILVQPIAGALSDRIRLPFGRRLPFIFAGTVVACLLVPGLGFAQSFLVFFVLLAIITIAVNVAQGPFQAFIPDLVPADKRGPASAYKTGAEIVGIAVIGGLIGFIAGHYKSSDDGFHWMWASLGLMTFFFLVAMVLTMLRVKENPQLSDRAATQLSAPELRDPAHDRFFPPGFMWFLVSRFLFLGATGILETFGLFYLRDVVEVESPAQGVGVLSIVLGLAALLGALGVGQISDRIGYRPLIASSGLVGAIGIFLLLLAGSIEQVLAAGVVIGIAVGIFFSANWALATELVSPRRAAQQMGLTNIATAGGAAASRLLGFGVDALNTSTSDRGYEMLILICGVAFFVGGLLAFAVRPARPVARVHQ